MSKARERTDSMNADDFDWVEARSNCTTETVFAQLMQDVQNDLDKFSTLHPGPAQSRKFSVCGNKGDRFYVERTEWHRVIFEVVKSEIRTSKWLHMGDCVSMTAYTVRLGDNGKCRLIDENGKSWKPWQVRKKALEETLF